MEKVGARRLLPATRLHRHFPKAAEDSSIFRQFKIVFFIIIAIEEIKSPFSQYYDRKDTLQDRVLVWREKPVLAQAERARSPSGNPENYFWASSSSHLSTSTYTNNNSFDIKMKKKKSGWHTDILGIVVVTLPPFDPGSSRGATQCIETQTQEKQRSPLNVILLIHCDVNNSLINPGYCCGHGGAERTKGIKTGNETKDYIKTY